MIEQQGTIVDIQGEFAWVQTERQSSCGDCAAKAGCGTALLNRSMGKRSNRVRVTNSLGVRTGDCVVLGVPEQALLKGSFVIYALPLLCLLLAALGTHLLFADATPGWRDLAALIGGTVGFGVGLFWARRVGEQGGISRNGFQPVLVRCVANQRGMTSSPAALHNK